MPSSFRTAPGTAPCGLGILRGGLGILRGDLGILRGGLGILRGAAVAATLCALVLVPAGTALAQGAVLPPGLEDEVAALVFDRADAEGLGGGAHVTGARIERSYVDVSFGADGASGRVRLVERGQEVDGHRVGDTPSFSVWLVDGDDEPRLRRAAEALRTRIAERDQGDFFETHAVAPPDGGRPEVQGSTWLHAVRAALWILLLGSLIALWWRRRESLLRADLRDALVLFVGALALRLLIPPWAPLHANEHGIAELRGLLGEPDGYEAALYGTAYLDFVRVLLAPFGRWVRGPFVIGAVVGGLAPVAIFASARALAPTRRLGAAVAGVALAVHPIHVRLSLSESSRTLAGTLFLVGVALAACALRGRRGTVTHSVAWLAAAAAWALASELRVLTLLLPVAGLALVLVAVGRRRGLPSPWVALLAIAILGAVTAAHLGVLEAAVGASSGRSDHLMANLMRGLEGRGALLDPTLTPWLLPALAAACAARLVLIGERRLVAGLACAFVILWPASFLVWGSRTDAIRYQADAHLPVILLLCAVPGPSRAVPLREWAAWSVAPLALLVSAVPGWRDVARPDVHAQAYAIAIAEAPPPPTPILVPPHEMQRDRRVRSEFPTYAIDRSARVDTQRRPGCVAWIGVPCWSFTDEELRPGGPALDVADRAPMRIECVELLGGAERARAVVGSLTPIDVPHRSGEFHSIPARHPRVGYVPCPSERR